MNLSQLLENSIGMINPSQLLNKNNIEINGITANSKEISQNDMFVAISGYKHDGHDFIEDAIQAGAAVIVGEKHVDRLSVPYLKVPNSRSALAKIASLYYKTSYNDKIFIGVTGTNGKTTTCFMLKHGLEAAGYTCALFSTVYNVVNGQITPSRNTTIDALELHRLLSVCKDDIVIIEASSHGLSQFRLDGIEFDYCVFTNLDHEHLDYHKDMDEYFSVKAGLFNQLKLGGKAIINSYDSWGEKLYRSLQVKGKTALGIGEADFHMQVFRPIKEEHTAAVLSDIQGQYPLNLQVMGIHNIYNAALAYLILRDISIPCGNILQSMHSFKSVPGRFEVTKHRKEVNIVVDYAHTADAFFHCLMTARESGAGRIIHVFGFRGNRDESKRQGMVDVSSELSDIVILTLDDLNGISYEDMLDELYRFSSYKKIRIVPDRTLAIQCAVTYAEKGDWVFITGKGHEKYKQSFFLPSSSDDETVRLITHNRLQLLKPFINETPRKTN